MLYLIIEHSQYMTYYSLIYIYIVILTSLHPLFSHYFKQFEHVCSSLLYVVQLFLVVFKSVKSEPKGDAWYLQKRKSKNLFLFIIIIYMSLISVLKLVQQNLRLIFIIIFIYCLNKAHTNCCTWVIMHSELTTHIIIKEEEYVYTSKKTYV